MNTKFPWVLLALVLLAIFFVPLIPNDSPIDCDGIDTTSCDQAVGYVSVYTKFLK